MQSPIEDLALPGTFDVVLLGSFLVHGPTAAALLADLPPARRLRRLRADPARGRGLAHPGAARARDRAGVARVVSDVEDRDGLRSVHVEYEFPDARWTQTFRTRPLTVEQFERLLIGAGLFVDRYLTPDGTWVAASPVALTGAAPSSVRSGSTRSPAGVEQRGPGQPGTGAATGLRWPSRSTARTPNWTLSLEMSIVTDVDVADPGHVGPVRGGRLAPHHLVPGQVRSRCRPASAAWSGWSAAWCR